jgi:hypothetical protein
MVSGEIAQKMSHGMNCVQAGVPYRIESGSVEGQWNGKAGKYGTTAIHSRRRLKLGLWNYKSEKR